MLFASKAKARRRRDQQVESRERKQLEEGIDYPTLGELRALLTIQGRWRPLIVTVIFTGLRASELRGLTWNDIDFEKGVVTVRQRADRWNKIGNPKSKAGKSRAVPLVPMVINTLREWKLACPKGSNDLVFPTGFGTVQSLADLYRSLRPVQTAAGIAKPYGLHALRHSAASLFIQEGWSPKRVQVVMGHSSIQVTFDTYGHLFKTPDEKEELARLQARLIS
jgi:integrase